MPCLLLLRFLCFSCAMFFAVAPLLLLDYDVLPCHYAYAASILIRATLDAITRCYGADAADTPMPLCLLYAVITHFRWPAPRCYAAADITMMLLASRAAIRRQRRCQALRRDIDVVATLPALILLLMLRAIGAIMLSGCRCHYCRY